MHVVVDFTTTSKSDALARISASGAPSEWQSVLSTGVSNLPDTQNGKSLTQVKVSLNANYPDQQGMTSFSGSVSAGY